MIEPRLVDFMFSAHRSVEPAHTAMLSLLGLAPILDLGIHLSGGS